MRNKYCVYASVFSPWKWVAAFCQWRCVSCVWFKNECVCACDAEEQYIFCLKAVSSACAPFIKVWQINLFLVSVSSLCVHCFSVGYRVVRSSRTSSVTSSCQSLSSSAQSWSCCGNIICWFMFISYSHSSSAVHMWHLLPASQRRHKQTYLNDRNVCIYC